MISYLVTGKKLKSTKTLHETDQSSLNEFAGDEVPK